MVQSSVPERGSNPLQRRKARSGEDVDMRNGKDVLGEGAVIGEARIGQASILSLSDVVRHATVAEFSGQLSAAKDPLSVLLTSSLKFIFAYCSRCFVS